MNPLAHMLTGALIGQSAPTPAAALIGGLVSHLVLDAIPHTEGETFGRTPGRRLRCSSKPHLPPDLIEAALEFVLGVGLLWWLTRACPGAHALPLGLGAFAGLLPDLIDQPLERIWGVTLVHPKRLHWTVGRRHAVLGIFSQVTVAGTAALLLWRLSGCG